MLTPATATPPAADAGAAISVKGTVSGDELDCASALISAVLARHRRTVAYARVRVSSPPTPGAPSLVQVNLRVCGAPARIQIAAPMLMTAIPAAAARLHRQILRLSRAWEPWPWPDPERPPLYVPEPAPIARLKSFKLHRGSACQAAAILNAMDYDVYLFTDAETGEDAVVYRAGPTGIRLARQRIMRPPSLPGILPLTVNPYKTPVLTAGQAGSRLSDGSLPFVFYTDAATRRGSLLYRRYDGDLGLITAITTS